MRNIREDLAANSKLRGLFGAIAAYFLVPGFQVLVNFRAAQYARKRPLGSFIAKLLWLANARRGVYLALSSEIGGGLRLPHPTAIVIGDGVFIGEYVTIYQGVTVGRRENAAADEYPAIGQRAVIYAGATIIGAAQIGEGAVVGAHALVNGAVPPGSLAIGVPYKVRSR